MFLLHDVHGYEHNEIAGMLSCSIGNSKSQLHKARKRLRSLLARMERRLEQTQASVAALGEIDRTYAADGEVVAERAIGVDGPIREYYLVSSADTDDVAKHRTEVCWPVFHTGVGA